MLTLYFHVCKLWVLALKTYFQQQNACEAARIMEQQVCEDVSRQYTDNWILMEYNV